MKNRKQYGVVRAAAKKASMLLLAFSGAIGGLMGTGMGIHSTFCGDGAYKAYSHTISEEPGHFYSVDRVDAACQVSEPVLLEASVIGVGSPLLAAGAMSGLGLAFGALSAGLKRKPVTFPKKTEKQDEDLSNPNPFEDPLEGYYNPASLKLRALYA